MSVCLHGTTKLPLIGISWCLISDYISKPPKKFKFHQILKRISDPSLEGLYECRIICHRIIRRIEIFRNNLNRKSSHIYCVQYFFSENRSFFDTTYQNMLEKCTAYRRKWNCAQRRCDFPAWQTPTCNIYCLFYHRFNVMVSRCFVHFRLVAILVF